MIVSQEIAITVTITDITGLPASPEDITFKVKRPDGVLSNYTLASSNVQTVTPDLTYRCIIDAPIAGFYKCRVEAINSVSNVVGVDEATFYVRPSSL